jgi:hypothetical protein
MLVLFKYLGLTKELFQPELNIEVKAPGSASFTPGPDSPPRMSTRTYSLCWPERSPVHLGRGLGRPCNACMCMHWLLTASSISAHNHRFVS